MVFLLFCGFGSIPPHAPKPCLFPVMRPSIPELTKSPSTPGLKVLLMGAAGVGVSFRTDPSYEGGGGWCTHMPFLLVRLSCALDLGVFFMGRESLFTLTT